ncbi:MAG: hypothetical protein OEW75_01685, partial [Cyclobacteriaceae bacterium]|nr:hypothetical protein [Cyclobacteriaceae bacterium]
MEKRCVILFLFSLFGYTSIAQNQTVKITSGGIYYWEYLPDDYNLNVNNYPVVFFFHGLGERGDTEADLTKVLVNGPPKLVKNGTKFPFILISPQLKTNYGNWPPNYMDQVVETVKADLRIDLNRIYV